MISCVRGGSSPQICYHRQAKCQSNSSDSVVTQKALHRSSKNEKRSTIDSRAGGGQPILAVEAEAAKVAEPSSSSRPKYLMTTSKARSVLFPCRSILRSRCIFSTVPPWRQVEAAAMPPPCCDQVILMMEEIRLTTWDVYIKGSK